MEEKPRRSQIYLIQQEMFQESELKGGEKLMLHTLLHLLFIHFIRV